MQREIVPSASLTTNRVLVLLLAGVTFTLGCLFIALTWPEWGQLDWPGFLFFTFLSALAEILAIPLPLEGYVSVGLAVNVALLLLFPPGAAALAVGGAMVSGLFCRKFFQPEPFILERAAFNFGQISLAVGGAGTVYRALGGDVIWGLSERQIAALAGASLVYYLINVGLVTVVISLQSDEPLPRVWYRNFRQAILNYLALAPLGLLFALNYRSYGFPVVLLFFVPLLMGRQIFIQFNQLRDVRTGVAGALSVTLEVKDAYTRGHSDRVAEYAVLVAQELKLPEREVELIYYAGQLHDIGKVGVSSELLTRPGPLSQEELGEVRKHVEMGFRIISRLAFLARVAEIILYHHEWYSGRGGYPGHLEGEEIPLGARILMVCDSFDAMTTERPYRQRMTAEEAVRELIKGSGTQFDPRVVKACLSALRKRGVIPNGAGDNGDIGPGGPAEGG